MDCLFYILLAINLISGILLVPYPINLFLLAGLVAFWTKEASGLQAVLKNSAKFFTGALIPIDLLPEYFQEIIMLTPFPYILYFPTKIVMWAVSFQEFISACFICIVWIVIISIFNYKVWQNGLRKYESVGI